MFWKRLLLTVIAGLGATAAHAAPSLIDQTPSSKPSHISQAQAIAIRRQIADGPAALARERAAARAEGIPLDPEQLQFPLPPPDQNAAPLYQQLTQMLTQQPIGLPAYAEPLKAGFTYTPEQINNVQRTLAERQDVLSLIDQATARPQCIFTRDWSQGFYLPLPEYAKMREAARLLRTQSYLLAREGRYKEAIEKQSRGFRLAEHTASDPLVLSHLVGLAIEAITLAGLQDILTLAGPNPEVADQVQKAVTVRHSHLSLHHAAFGELAQALTMVEAVRRDGPDAFDQMNSPDDAPPASKDAWWNATPHNHRLYNRMLDAEAAVVIHRMRPIFAALDQPRPIRRRVFKQAEKNRLSEQKNPLNVVADISLSTFSKTDDKDTDLQAREQVTAAGAAALAAKARTGTFPDTLPDTFTDPFTGKPLGYRREGDSGFVVYSVGADGKFDGGKPSEYHLPFQVLFRYPGPMPQPVPPDMLK